MVLGVLVFDGLTVRETDACARRRGAAALRRAARGVRRRAAAPRCPGLRTRAVSTRPSGLDPTKTRPSNESLLRRALKGEPLYRINTLVDVVNLCSLRYQLPYGLYDRARMQPPVVLRMGREGESYEGIRKGSSQRGASARCSSTKWGPSATPPRTPSGRASRSRRETLVVVVYAPSGYAATRFARALDGTVDAVTRHCGGSSVERFVLPG